MGQALGNLKNAGNIQEADPGDLSGAEKTQRGLFGGVTGGLQAYGKQQQQQHPQGGGAQILPSQAPTYDFSQIGQPKRNPFYGGY